MFVEGGRSLPSRTGFCDEGKWIDGGEEVFVEKCCVRAPSSPCWRYLGSRKTSLKAKKNKQHQIFPNRNISIIMQY